jgi:hypothetical protein
VAEHVLAITLERRPPIVLLERRDQRPGHLHDTLALVRLRLDDT